MRYKEFNTNKVLENCMHLFWQNGIEPTAISDLVDKTKVNRFSLYKEFENKEGILLKTLDLYYDRYSSKQISILDQNKSAKETLLAFYTSYLLPNNNHPPGCFMIHTSSELADTNEKVKNKLNLYIEEIESQIFSLLEKNGYSKENSYSNSLRLVGLFCSSMCFCLIQKPKERVAYLETSIDLILN